jgi:hypothetical protein
VLLFLTSLVVVAASVRVFGGGVWTLLGVLIAPPTVALLALGQLDAWVLLGVLLGRWAVDNGRWAGLGLALPLVLIKPQVGSLVALLWVVTIPGPLRWRALALAGVVWFATCLTIRVWWPFGPHLPWGAVNVPKDISTPEVVRGLGLPPFVYPLTVIGLLVLWAWTVYRRGLSNYVLALSTLVGPLLSPHVLRHSFSVPLSVAYVFVARRSLPWAVCCYVLTWGLILISQMDSWQVWWEAGTWWVLLVALLLVGRRSPSQKTPTR